MCTKVYAMEKRNSGLTALVSYSETFVLVMDAKTLFTFDGVNSKQRTRPLIHQQATINVLFK